MTMFRSSENAPPPSMEFTQAACELGEKAARAGVLVDGAGFLPSAAGALIRLSGETVTATDGPFTETKEVIGGYAVFNVASRQEAIEWSRRFMNLRKDLWKGWQGECEIRRIMEAPRDDSRR